MESEESCVYPDDEPRLELGLALVVRRREEYYKEFDSSEVSSSSSSSSSSPPARQVVGWPPIRSFRMNNQAKLPLENYSNKNVVEDDDFACSVQKEKELLSRIPSSSSSFVKVTMDGIPIGRKVDLKAHDSYSCLAHSLDQMFQSSLFPGEERAVVTGLLGDFVLAYEDKAGHWMLVGDVPWDMFLNSARRLRIMRSAEAANGIRSIN